MSIHTPPTQKKEERRCKIFSRLFQVKVIFYISFSLISSNDFDKFANRNNIQTLFVIYQSADTHSIFYRQTL